MMVDTEALNVLHRAMYRLRLTKNDRRRRPSTKAKKRPVTVAFFNVYFQLFETYIFTLTIFHPLDIFENVKSYGYRSITTISLSFWREIE